MALNKTQAELIKKLKQDENNLRVRKWSKEEDEILMALYDEGLNCGAIIKSGLIKNRTEDGINSRIGKIIKKED